MNSIIAGEELYREPDHKCQGGNGVCGTPPRATYVGPVHVNETRESRWHSIGQEF